MESTTSLPELLANAHLGKVSVPDLYSPLNVSKKEIRVLRLSSIPNKDDDFIQCTLSIISLENDTDFIPLSYVWGDATKTTEIFVNGVSFQATLNLVDFFRHYRFLPDNYHKTALWVDAICINQGDLEERGQQVGLMTDIYGGPPLTISWLGPQSVEEKSDLAVEWIVKIAKDIEEADDVESLEWLEKNAKDLLTGSTPGPVWSSIGSLLSRPYWTRVWTTQECVLPDENVFLCGSRHFYYSQMALLDGAMEYTCDDGCNELIATIPSAPENQHHLRQLLTFHEFTFSTLGLRKISNIQTLKSFREIDGRLLDEGPEEQESLELHQSWGATFAMKDLNATDPRDYVYGAGGMCPCPVIDIDYAKSVKDLFIEHAALPIRIAYIIHTTAFMTLLLGITGHGKGGNAEDLPSWVPNWGKTLPWYSYDDANASGQKDGEWEVSTLPVAEGPVLRVFGVNLTGIEFVQRRDGRDLFEFITQTIDDFYDSDWAPIDKFQEVLKVFLGISYELETTDENDGLWVYTCALLVYLLDESILSTTGDMENQVAQTENQQNHNDNTREKVKRMDLILNSFGLFSHGNNPHNFWDHLFPAGLVSPLSTEQFEVIAAKAQQKLLTIQTQDDKSKKPGQIYFRTEDGYMGFTSGEILPGDVLCVFLGCAEPVILREVGEHYLHIGLCFVAHLMDGEAFTDLNGEPTDVEILRFDIH